MTTALLVSLGISLATFLVFVGMRERLSGTAPEVARLKEYLASNRPLREELGQRRRPLMATGILRRLNALLARQNFAGEIATSLARANVRMTVSEWLIVVLSSACVAAAPGFIVTRNLVFAVLLGALGFLVPGWVLKWMQNRRVHAFDAQLPDVLMLIVGSLRAGYSLLHSLDIVAQEVAPPASQEFERVVREVALGLSLQEALDNLTNRVPSDDLALIVTAINIQHEVGGNLATVLDTISDTIRQRIRIQGEIRVLTAQQTMTGYVLSLLPFILGAILYMINPHYMSRLFEPGPILIIPASAILMVFAGFMVIRKIVAIDV